MSFTEERIRRLEQEIGSIGQRINLQTDIIQEMMARQKVRDNAHQVIDIDMTKARTNSRLDIKKLFNGIPAHSFTWIAVSGTLTYSFNVLENTLQTASVGDKFTDEDIESIFLTNVVGSGNSTFRVGTWVHK